MATATRPAPVRNPSSTSTWLTAITVLLCIVGLATVAAVALLISRDVWQPPPTADSRAASAFVPAASMGLAMDAQTAQPAVTDELAGEGTTSTDQNEAASTGGTSPPADYFEQLAAAYAYFAAVYPAVGEDKLIEVKGPEGVFTVRISNSGFTTTLRTPGGNSIELRSLDSSGTRTIYDVVESQGQTLFAIKGRGYQPYDPVLDELQEPVAWRQASWHPERGFGLERVTRYEGYPAAKVGPYYLFFECTSGRQGDGMLSESWIHFAKVVTMDLAQRRMVQHYFEGPETGTLKAMARSGPSLDLTFRYNATRDLRVVFSPETGFGEVAPIPVR